MDLSIVLGWDDTDAYDILLALKVIPAQNPSNGDEYNPHEFVVSDAGIRYVQNELDLINQRFGTTLQWRMYPDDNFVLVWRDELFKMIGDPVDTPVQKFYINHKKDVKWRTISSSFDLPSTPILIAVVDASSYYHTYIYDQVDSIDESRDDSLG
jgi:hypothetical protein